MIVDAGAGRGSRMGVLIVLALLIVLDVAALVWGHDSRDGCDWRPCS